MFLVLNINTEVNKTQAFGKINNSISFFTILILNRISPTRYTMQIVKRKKELQGFQFKEQNKILKNQFNVKFDINNKE